MNRDRHPINIRELSGDANFSGFPKTDDVELKHALYQASAEILYPLIYQLCRAREIGLNHFRCASGMTQLAPECMDNVHTETEAAVDDFIRNAKQPIRNVEGWVRARHQARMVDAHRRRRGARGALQRPRLSQWLIKALPAGPWPQRLALELLEWVGVEQTAGIDTWPLTAWADLRMSLTGEHDCTERRVAEDVAAVLAAMRSKPQWYELFVERPLSKKQTSVLPGSRMSAEPAREPEPLALVDDHELADTRLRSRATVALSQLAAVSTRAR